MKQLCVEALQFFRIETRRSPGNLRKIEEMRQGFEALLGMKRFGRPYQRSVGNHGQRLEAFFAKPLDRERTKPFRQRLALGSDEKIVMREHRRLCAKRLEYLDLNGRVRDVVLAANDVRDTGVSIIGHAREGYRGACRLHG